MSKRLQVLIPDELDVRLQEAARRAGISKETWARRAIECVLEREQPEPDPLQRLASLDAPTADIDEMLAEIEAGQRRQTPGT